MWDSESRPVFKTYEECEDWAISMRPKSFQKNAKWGVHVSEDWVTRCSQWCHYKYWLYGWRNWVFICNKTIYSTRDHFNYFEKIFDKLDEWRSYERFEKAFWSKMKTIWCDIIINNNIDERIYSYFVWIWHKIGIAPAAIDVKANDKITTKQTNQINWKTFYVQQVDGLIYVRWDIFERWIWKIYEIKGLDDSIVFPNVNKLFLNENIEISCHNDFDTRSDNTRKKFYTLPENIERLEAWEIDDIFYRLYQDNV